MTPDLLIRGGELFDPETQSFKTADIAVANGKIARIGKPLQQEQAEKVIDAGGMIVTPGLIDFHVHCFRKVHRISIDPDELAPRAGATTMVDAGSAGALNFDAFREFVLEKSKLNLFAFLNISLIGQCFEAQIPGVPVIHEYDDLRLVHVEQTVKCLGENPEFLVGVKVRAHHGLTNLTPVHAALEAADEAGLPLMIHTSPPPPSTREYMDLLRPGDIVTHLYHPNPGSLVDRQGKVRSEYRDARERGVLMETGFARWHTDFEVMRCAVDQGFWPDIIGTDVTTTNINDLVYDLMFTASKFLAVGMPLEDVLAAMTLTPAQAMNRAELAQLREGAPADISILKVQQEDTRFRDYYGHTMNGKERIECRYLVRNGDCIPGESSVPRCSQ
jgi:dihydroorotase